MNRVDDAGNRDPTAEAMYLLHRSGWSTGVTRQGETWVVDGRNGENRILATGATEPLAWHAAIEQARDVGEFTAGSPAARLAVLICINGDSEDVAHVRGSGDRGIRGEA